MGELFACQNECRKPGGYKFRLSEQTDRNCILPGFDLSTWTGERLVQIRMGAPPEYEREGKNDHDTRGPWHEPYEDISEEGCPGAWYRTPFVESLLRYYRRRDDQGNRVPNPALDRCEDHLVHEAVLELEHHEDAWRAEWDECRYELMRQKNDS